MVTQCRYGTISMVELSVYSIITSSYLLSNFLHNDRSFTSAVVLGTSFTEASRKTNTRIVLCVSLALMTSMDMRSSGLPAFVVSVSLSWPDVGEKERRTTHWGGGGGAGEGCVQISSSPLFSYLRFVSLSPRFVILWYATHHETLISTSLT